MTELIMNKSIPFSTKGFWDELQKFNDDRKKPGYGAVAVRPVAERPVAVAEGPVVEVTEVKPANVVTVAPRETEVDPIVTELLVSPALFTAPDALTFGVSSDRFLLMVIVDPYYVFIIKEIISSTK